MENSCQRPLHAIVVPFPAQGHITPMTQLALKLLRDDTPFTHITFINTQFDHDLILANGRSCDLFAIPGLKLISIADGLPPGHGRLNDGRIQEFGEAIDSMEDALGKLIEHLVSEALSSPSEPPIACIIADIYFYSMSDIAHRVALPWAAFWTTPTHASLAYSCISDLLAQGIVPVNRKTLLDCMSSESTQRWVNCIPAVPPLKAFELPSFLLTEGGSADDYFFQWTLRRFGVGVPQRATWHLANTTYLLEQEAVHAIQERLGGDFWPVGPLLPQEFFSSQMHAAPATGTSLWAEDTRCKEWLDKQDDGSVLYISVGSIVHFTSRQVEELAAGVEASGRPFLWVLRTDVDAATHSKLGDFRERTRQRGLIVSWAAQFLVLSHRSVGAFLTHCGWNSILEAISGGVPILAWPGGFAEQLMNANYITDVWENGVAFQKEITEGGGLLVTREEVERVVLEVFSVCSKRSQTLKERASQLQKMVRDSVLSAHGSSQINLDCFVKAVTQWRPLELHDNL